MPSREIVRRYWDASCFITLLNNEGGAQDCENILNEVKESKTILYVSPLVQVEVIRPRSSSHPISQQMRAKIQAFFKNAYVKWRLIDRGIGDFAQELCWDYKLHPRDAIHLAVAIDLECDLLETYDPDLLKLNGRISNTSLSIQKPTWKGQTNFLDNG